MFKNKSRKVFQQREPVFFVVIFESLRRSSYLAAHLRLTSTFFFIPCEYDVEAGGTVPGDYLAETPQSSSLPSASIPPRPPPHPSRIFRVDRHWPRALSRTLDAFCSALENRYLHPIAPRQELSHEMQLCVRRNATPRKNSVMLYTKICLPYFWRLLPSP